MYVDFEKLHSERFYPRNLPFGMKILCPYKPHVECEVDVAPIVDVSMGYPTMH